MKNPRIQVTLSPELYDDLARISRLSGTSMSGLVAAMVEENASMFRQLRVTLDKAAHLQGSLSSKVSSRLFDIERALSKSAHDAQSHLDELQYDLEQYLEQMDAREGAGVDVTVPAGSVGAGASAPALPPAINKGAKSGSGKDNARGKKP